jgi:hypothetical protein
MAREAACVRYALGMKMARTVARQGAGDMPVRIKPFVREHCFDDEALRAMGSAYDKAQALLHDRGQPAVVKELIASAIIDIATTGERDPNVLARGALKALGLDVDRVA